MTQISEYEVLRLLGQGGSALVYLVRHRVLGTTHALKVLRRGASTDRFLQEGVLQSRLRSPHVVPVLATLDVDGAPALLMPRVIGCSLRDLLQTDFEVHHAEAHALFCAILDGVVAIHAAGIVHRDLKPSNALLDLQDGVVIPRLSDFGVARSAQAEGWTQSGHVLGTPRYTAPEQRADPSSVDQRADLWSLGVLLEELHPRGLPPTLQAVRERLGQTAPEARFPTADALRAELESPDRAVLAVGRRLARQVAHVHRMVVEPTYAESDGGNPLPGGIPQERDTFVGRDTELASLHEALGSFRLVTVVGFGGMGKTRLVARYARDSAERWAGGVAFCDLSEARTDNGILHAVAKGVGIPLAATDPVGRLGRAMAGRGPCLVVLDNVEQVAKPVGILLGTWFDMAADARFVVTSRAALRIPGEHPFRLTPLPLDDAIALFMSRANAVVPDRPLSAAAPGLPELVRLLDRLPLAIELAASRSRVMSPDELLTRMSDRLRLLATPTSTMRQTLDWSWDLLEPPLQSGLGQLSVFEAGFTLDAAEAVVRVDGTWALDVLQELVDHSLVRVLGDGRFDLLMTIKAYAFEKLGHLGLGQGSSDRHAAFYARWGTDAALGALGPSGAPERQRRMVQEADNLVAACRHAAGCGEPATAVACLRAAWSAIARRGPYGLTMTLADEVSAGARMPAEERAQVDHIWAESALRVGLFDEAQTRMTTALERTAGLPASGLRAQLQLVRAQALQELGHPDAAAAAFDDALEAARTAEEPALMAHVQWIVGRSLGRRGQAEASLDHVCAALSGFRRLDHRWGQCGVYPTLGLLHARAGRIDEARAAFEASANLLEEVGDVTLRAQHSVSVATFLHITGRLEEARTAYREAIALGRKTGDLVLEALSLGNMGQLDSDLGHPDTARTQLERALAMHRKARNRWNIAIVLANLGMLCGSLGDDAAAERYYREAIEVYEAVGNLRDRGIGLLNLAGLLWRTERPEEARRVFDRSREVLEPTGDRRLVGCVLLCIANLDAFEGQRDDATSRWQQAETAFRAVEADLQLGELLAARATWERIWGNSAADTWLAEAEAIAHRIGAGPDSSLGVILEQARSASD